MFLLANSRFRFSPYATSNAVLSALNLSSATRKLLVLCVSSDHASTTVNFCSASFADSAERSAPSTIFFGSAYAYERGFGPWTVPPCRHNGERIEPTRARPVPFCFQSLRPAPLTSLLSLVLCVPERVSRRYQREASCRRCALIFTPKTASANSSEPTFLPSRLKTSTTGIISRPSQQNSYCKLCNQTRGILQTRNYFLTRALRMKMYCPRGPGTEPRTNSRFSSLSTLMTFKFRAVTRSLPMCPGKCWFFHTRDGKEDPPMPPGAR